MIYSNTEYILMMINSMFRAQRSGIRLKYDPENEWSEMLDHYLLGEWWGRRGSYCGVIMGILA